MEEEEEKIHISDQGMTSAKVRIYRGNVHEIYIHQNV